MVDVGVGKVPLGAAKPPSRMDGGIGPTGPPFNMREELTVPFPGLGCSVLLRSAGETELNSPRECLD
jgi:hypothetical protein